MAQQRRTSTDATATSAAETTAVTSRRHAPSLEAPGVGPTSLNEFCMDWSPLAKDGQHVWIDAESRDNLCYVCGEGKHTSRGPRQKCMPCKVVVHNLCMPELVENGVMCRRTFQELRAARGHDRYEHHWVRQRKAFGKCTFCLKNLIPKLLKSSKDFTAVGCSWCKVLYHSQCFSADPTINNSPCHLGEFRSHIVPRQWITRLMRAGAAGQSRAAGRHAIKRSFVVRKSGDEVRKPLLAFVNPKSGGNQGAKVLAKLLWLLNPRQVFNLLKGGPELALSLYRRVPRLRILVCGGDGTVGWVLSEIDKLGIRPCPPIAVLPLGTGNDLARTLGWGAKYTDDSLTRVLHSLSNAAVVRLDRWDVLCSPGAPAPEVLNEDGEENVQSASQPPLPVFNNYFSIGADALVSLEFHESRQANPERFNSRWYNMMFYAGAGGKEILERKSRDFSKYVGVLADGVDLTPLIRREGLAAIVFLNISHYSGGTKPWGSGDSEFGEARVDDGLIEVIGLNSMTMASLRLGRPGVRITQAREVTIITSRALPVQVDGEPCRLAASTLQIKFRNQAMMLARIKSSGNDPNSRSIANLGELVQSVPSAPPPASRPTSDASSRLLDDDEGAINIPATVVREEEIPLPESSSSLDVDNLLGQLHLDGVDIDGVLDDGVQSGDEGDSDAFMVTPTVYDAPLDSSQSESSLGLGANKVHSNTAIETLGTSHLRGAVRLSSMPLLTPAEDNQQHQPLYRIRVHSMVSREPLASSDSSRIDMEHSLVNACKQGNLDVVKRLCNMGASLSARDDQGLLPLHHAVRHKRLDVVLFLLGKIPRAGLAAVDTRKQQTALHKAAWYGYMDIAAALVKAGTPILPRDYEGLTAYQRSLASSNSELQQYLCELEVTHQIEEADL